MDYSMQKSKSLVDERVELAKAFGLKTEGLISFNLVVTTRALPVINAVYRNTKFDEVTAIGKKFELHPIGTDESVELFDCGDGTNDDTTLDSNICHFVFNGQRLK